MHLVVAARTAPNRAVRFGGEHDDLDSRGRRDAAALASRLPRAGRVIAGPERSVTQTARLACGLFGVDPRLASLDVGHWRSTAPESVDPAQLGAWFGDPLWSGHGGESVGAFVGRIRGVLAALAAGGPATLVVAGPVAQAVLCEDAASFFAADVCPGGLYTVTL